jgi:hypothetical protein
MESTDNIIKGQMGLYHLAKEGPNHKQVNIMAKNVSQNNEQMKKFRSS